ncbi:hypothetical protein AWJ20_682 [Sugiyamaella lignohabitans]|uniref:Coiled-coil domain-containing protein 25 n=1 Tax=Sugiyamaella lignohabitans TaxID=796027 RepID=A0A167D3B3_9ASCO|nr:uncharacterized protein AWJ20_682 [Sugiyamaella lignohabitans]ANB12429.1 hypothetical protein AWJ20_682 [Sugiyamaella lignohabitans]
MAVGQVGFKKDKQVKKVHVETRVNAIINRLNKTKTESFPDLQKERADYDKEQARTEVERRQQRLKKEAKLARERKELAHQKKHAYDSMFDEEQVRHSSNQFRPDDWEDDFM